MPSISPRECPVPAPVFAAHNPADMPLVGQVGMRFTLSQHRSPWAAWHPHGARRPDLRPPGLASLLRTRDPDPRPSCHQGRRRSEGPLVNPLNCSVPQFSSPSVQREVVSPCCATLALTPRQLRPWAWRGRGKLSGADSCQESPTWGALDLMVWVA